MHVLHSCKHSYEICYKQGHNECLGPAVQFQVRVKAEPSSSIRKDNSASLKSTSACKVPHNQKGKTCMSRARARVQTAVSPCAQRLLQAAWLMRRQPLVRPAPRCLPALHAQADPPVAAPSPCPARRAARRSCGTARPPASARPPAASPPTAHASPGAWHQVSP